MRGLCLAPATDKRDRLRPKDARGQHLRDAEEGDNNPWIRACAIPADYICSRQHSVKAGSGAHFCNLEVVSAEDISATDTIGSGIDCRLPVCSGAHHGLNSPTLVCFSLGSFVSGVAGVASTHGVAPSTGGNVPLYFLL